MSMSDIDLIDEYLTNRMDEGARATFEQKIKSDPQLKSEVDLQRDIIETVKQARVIELKTMLNNVPVGGGAVSNALLGKAALATISAGILGTILYLTFSTDSTEPIEQQQPAVEQLVTPEPTPEQTVPTVVEEHAAEPTTQSEVKKSASDVKKMPTTKPALPKLDVMEFAPEEHVDSNRAAEAPKPNSTPTVSASAIEVETDNTNKTYPFHYQFKNGKLVLYGPFDSSLYEVIEINGATHALFLYYKDSYYHLDNRERSIVPLIMIRDTELLDKLKQYRNRK